MIALYIKEYEDQQIHAGHLEHSIKQKKDEEIRRGKTANYILNGPIVY